MEKILRRGSCQCGAVRFSSEAETSRLYVCHCRECQKQSGSAFGMSLEVPRSGLKLLAGEVGSWERDTDGGGRLRCVFCIHCGSRLWHESTDRPRTVTLKAGSLDEPVDIAAATHIWTKRKLKGLVIPADALHFAEEPPS